ncbi:MAG: hypothetical protein AAGI01_03780 [Myxococcota bacterium]
MEDQTKITSEAALMMERMNKLEANEPRYKVLQAALHYKASWLELAEHLNVVAMNKSYKEWGFKTFKDYCVTELQLRQSVARKLVRGFQWIDKEAPEFLHHFVEGIDVEAPHSSVPDVDTIDVLVKAQKERAKENLSDDVYDVLKQKALAGDHTAAELKKQMKEALPIPEKDPRAEQLKTLRRTLSAAERILHQLEEAVDDEDQELVHLAEQLRERVFELVSRKLDEAAYTDGGDSADAADAALEHKRAEKPVGAKIEQVTVLVGTPESVLGD